VVVVVGVVGIVARMVRTTTTMVMLLSLIGMDNDDVDAHDGLFDVASAWFFCSLYIASSTLFDRCYGCMMFSCISLDLWVLFMRR